MDTYQFEINMENTVFANSLSLNYLKTTTTTTKTSLPLIFFLKKVTHSYRADAAVSQGGIP